MKAQQGFHKNIIPGMHSRLAHNNSSGLEVIPLRGSAAQVREIAVELSSTKNVKLGRFVRSTLAKKME